MDVRIALAAVGFAVLVAAASLLVPPGVGSSVEPVPFDRTLSMGMTGVDVREAREAGYAVPRAEVFYAQYRFVVGYYGIGSAVGHLESGHARRQFGRPVAVFVTGYDTAAPELVEGGYLRADARAGVRWVRARDAHFVVGSPARTTAGPTPVPFDRAADAREFASKYGGRVVDWPALRDRTRTRAAVDRDRVAGIVANRTGWADRRAAATAELLDRPVSVVVGRGAPTLQAAVDRAPPNTTVRVPPGTYETNLTITKPITLRGAGNGTVIRGPGTGTVVRANASHVAIADCRITGVGPNDTGSGEGNRSGWDAKIALVYGRGDAGVHLHEAPGSLVADVRIETRANGVLLWNASGTVVRNISVAGTERWENGSMGVLAMYSRVVVQDSTFVDGRDGVYTHRAHGIVVRDSRMRSMRFGVHEMYTSRALVANNTVAETDVGLIVMTRPRGNVLVGNRVTDSVTGLSLAGDASYAVRNRLVGNEYGMTVGATRSLYARNTIVANRVGIRSDTILPTNRVVGNDVVGNGRPATASGGPLAIWSAGGRGNYWGPTPGFDRDGDGVIDRAYRPTARTDRLIGRAGTGPTLARSPALGLVRLARTAAPGLRHGDVVDLAPLADPVRPAVLAEVRAS